MKYEYSHDFSANTMMRAQTELAKSIYPKYTEAIILMVTLTIFLSIILPAMLLGAYFAGHFFGDKAKLLGLIFGLIIGFVIYPKKLVSKITEYFDKKRKVPIGKDCTSHYIFESTGITVVEPGRKTTIEWSAISAVEQTPNYIGLLCYGLFYYLPRETFGGAAGQSQFISQCKQWMAEAKKL